MTNKYKWTRHIKEENIYRLILLQQKWNKITIRKNQINIVKSKINVQSEKNVKGDDNRDSIVCCNCWKNVKGDDNRASIVCCNYNNFNEHFCYLVNIISILSSKWIHTFLKN